MKNKSWLLSTALISVALVGCNQEEKVAEVGGSAIAKEAYESYLKLKRIPLNDKVKYERMLEVFAQNKALATGIEGEGEFDKALVKAEVEEFRKQIVINRYFEKYLKDSVSDAAIQNYYAENQEQFSSKKIHLAHVLFRVHPSMDETQRKAILTTAHEAYSKLQAGADFAEMAQNLSEDKVSATKGGDLGWIKKGTISEEFTAKAFEMSKGEVSQPILTSFGFHIINVIDEVQVVKKPLEAVKGDIRYQLRNKAKQAERKRLIKKVGYTIASNKAEDK